MTNIALAPVPVRSRRPIVPYTDLTRGASQFGLRRAGVFLQTRVLHEYVEVDSAIGHNTVGVILSVLAYHLAGQPGTDGQLTIGLRRRTDDQLVEVDLGLRHSRAAGGERISLHWLGEREFPSAETTWLTPS